MIYTTELKYKYNIYIYKIPLQKNLISPPQKKLNINHCYINVIIYVILKVIYIYKNIITLKI